MYLEDDPQLGLHARTILDDSDSRLVVPTIVLAEALWGLRKKKANTSVWDNLLASMRADPRVALYPITVEVIDASPTGLEMHDAMICATVTLLRDATGDEVKLLTKDEAIIGSGLVQAIW